MSTHSEQLNSAVQACPVQLDLYLLNATIADAPSWAVLMETLYRLCRENPDHSDLPGSNAKIWLVGRGLATGVERQIAAAGGQGSSLGRLCEHVYAKHKQADEIIAPLRELEEPLDSQKLCRIIEAHGRFCRLIQPVLREGRSARSFAAKYLHCHAPVVPIFDSIASRNLSRICPCPQVALKMPKRADASYHGFALRFWHLYNAAREMRPDVTVRQLDLYLLSLPSNQGDEETRQGRKERTLKVLQRHGVLTEGMEIEVMPDAIPPDAGQRDAKLFRARIGNIDSQKSVSWAFDGNDYSLSDLSWKLMEHGLSWVRPKTFQLWRLKGEKESMWDQAEKRRVSKG
jgi:hypothetical protein